jgi:hypothetical protein
MREVVPIGHVQHEPVTVFQVVCGSPRVRNRAGESSGNVLAPVAHHKKDLTSGCCDCVRKSRIPEIRVEKKLATNPWNSESGIATEIGCARIS